MAAVVGFGFALAFGWSVLHAARAGQDRWREYLPLVVCGVALSASLLAPWSAWAAGLEFDARRALREQVARNVLEEAAPRFSGSLELEGERALVSWDGAVEVRREGKRRWVVFVVFDDGLVQQGVAFSPEAEAPPRSDLTFEQWEELAPGWYGGRAAKR